MSVRFGLEAPLRWAKCAHLRFRHPSSFCRTHRFAAGARAITLHDLGRDIAEALADRLRRHYPRVEVRVGDNDPAGYDLVVVRTDGVVVEDTAVTE